MTLDRAVPLQRAAPHDRRTPLPRQRKPRTSAEEEAWQTVRARADGVCEIHGGHAGTDWSHRRSAAQLGPMTVPNGLWVCRPAHDWIEAHAVAADLGGWRIVHRDPDPATVAVWLRPALVWPGWWLLDEGGLYVTPEDCPAPPERLPPDWLRAVAHPDTSQR